MSYEVAMNLGRVGCTGIVYDGINLSDVFEIRDLKMTVLPKIEAVLMDIAQMSGSYFVARKIRTREIKMTLALDAQSRCPVDIFQAWREHSNTIAKSKPAPLQLGEDAYVMAMLTDDTEIENEAYKGVVELTFTCFDPFFYGDEHIENLNAGDNVFPVYGRYATWPIIEVTGVTGSVEIREGSRVLKVDDLTESDTVIVDMERHCCMIDDVYKPADPEVSDFWPLQTGMVTVNLSAGSAVLRYQERSL